MSRRQKPSGQSRASTAIVGLGAGAGDVGGGGADGQDPAAGGLGGAVGAGPGAGVEDGDALDGGGLFEALDGGAFFGGVGVASGGHDDRDRGLVGPAQVEVGQFTVAGGLQGGQQVGLQAREQDLALRIAEPDVELDQLGAVFGQHEAGEQDALEGSAAAGHFVQGRADDELQADLLQPGWKGGDGAVGAHAAGVGAGVAVADALVVLGGTEQEGVFSVAEGEEGDFFALQAFLDDDRGVAEDFLVHDGVDGRQGFVFGGRDGDAFTGGQAVRLDDDRDATLADKRAGGVWVVETLPQGGGDAGGVGEFLGEGLAAFQLGGSFGRAAAGDAGGFHGVGEAGDQRGFGARHDQVDGGVLGEGDQAGDVERIDGDALGCGGDAWVAGGAPEFCQQRAVGDGPAQCVIASS